MPITTNRDKVRLMVGDTNEDDPLLYDDEVDAFLEQRTVLNSSGGTVAVNLAAAAADCAGAIAGKYARDFDFSEDNQNFSRAQRVGHYLQLERDLRNRSGGYAVSTGGTITT
jgi:hypothetical protein